MQYRNDIRNILIDNCVETKVYYEIEFSYEDVLERTVWMGDATDGQCFKEQQQ